MLLGNMDIVHIFHIHNQALTYAHEGLALFGQLLGYHTLYLPQLKGQKPYLSARLEKVAVVAVRRDVEDMTCCYPQQVVRG